MATIQEEIKLRLRDRYVSAQTTFGHNQNLIAALEDTIDYFDTSDPHPSSYFRLWYIREAYRKSLFSL
jgi:hypothetical protein